MTRLCRLRRLVALGVHRTIAQLRAGDRSRLLLAATGVAIAIGLMVVVTATSLGLAAESTIYSADVDYWIVPEAASASTMAVSVGGPQFGDAHPTGEYLTGLDGVESASPIAMQVVRVDAPDADGAEYVLVVGAIGRPGLSVAGLPLDALAPGDPYYANGTYHGGWTGDLVASRAAADILDVQRGDQVSPTRAGANRSFTVRAVHDASTGTGVGDLPVVVVHLAELQALQHAPPRDTADQFLVATSDPGVRDTLAGVYPASRVVERTGVTAQSLVEADLALAMALAAFLVALVLGTLVVTTALGLAITADREALSTLAAIGYAPRSVTTLVTTQVVAVTTIGGVLGVALGGVGILAVNALVGNYVGVETVATAHPVLVPYGVGVAILVGLVSAPYLTWLARHSSGHEHLTT